MLNQVQNLSIKQVLIKNIRLQLPFQDLCLQGVRLCFYLTKDFVAVKHSIKTYCVLTQLYGDYRIPAKQCNGC